MRQVYHIGATWRSRLSFSAPSYDNINAAFRRVTGARLAAGTNGQSTAADWGGWSTVPEVQIEASRGRGYAQALWTMGDSPVADAAGPGMAQAVGTLLLAELNLLPGSNDGWALTDQDAGGAPGVYRVTGETSWLQDDSTPAPTPPAAIQPSPSNPSTAPSSGYDAVPQAATSLPNVYGDVPPPATTVPASGISPLLVVGVLASGTVLYLLLRKRRT